MSVEPNELMSEIWTQWQGHVINDEFPLGRYVGGSEHSGVFVTNSAALGPADVAIKLIAADRVLVQSQLPRWAMAAGIVHPHLLKLLQWGECQLDGLPYLYLVMEYADQTLAQVLQGRALTDDETREMLHPILDALAFMHGQNLVQGELKPANILVVGDQLKLASDTIRGVGEATLSASPPTQYVAPEARRGGNSTAGDIWALGACLFEALTRRAPSGSGERSETVSLPADFSPVFKDVVARCLNPRPENRPSATQLDAWANGQALSPMPEAIIQPAATSPAEPTKPEPSRTAPPPPAVPEAVRPALPLTPSRNSRSVLLSIVVGAIVISVLGWIAVRAVRSHRDAAPSPVLEVSSPQVAGASAPVAADEPKSVAPEAPTESGRSDPSTSTSALHEVIPDVPASVRRGIRGHIKVRVRITVDPNGTVIAATPDRVGRNKHLQPLAVEAAWKWTFAPNDAQSRRTMQIIFDFSRDETTARVVTPKTTP
jgi:TonB family protein